jgi:hypothetical protein
VKLSDTIIGDTIDIHGHYPQVVTATGWQDAGIWGHSRLCWSAPGAEGITLLPDEMKVTLLREASPEARRQAEAQTEAALAAMLATTEG